MQPLISIIMPVYNAAETISYAIISLINQTYSNIEIIVIDDGSTDKTVEIVKSFTDNRIKLFKRNHLGPGTQRNFGIEKSEGEYIAFIDADDIAFRDRLEKQLLFMLSNPEVGILGSQAIVIDSKGQKIGYNDVPTDDIDYYLPIHCPIITPTIFFRKKIIQKVGFFSKMLEPATDYEWYVNANKKGIIIKNIKDRLMKKRLSSGSFTKRDKSILFRKMFYLGSTQIEELYRNKKIDYDYYFRKGLLNYYYFDCSKSIIFFFKAIVMKPNKVIINLRYIFPSLLGNRLLSLIRKRRISFIINRIIQLFGKNVSFLK